MPAKALTGGEPVTGTWSRKVTRWSPGLARTYWRGGAPRWAPLSLGVAAVLWPSKAWCLTAHLRESSDLHVSPDYGKTYARSNDGREGSSKSRLRITGVALSTTCDMQLAI